MYIYFSISPTPCRLATIPFQRFSFFPHTPSTFKYILTATANSEIIPSIHTSLCNVLTYMLQKKQIGKNNPKNFRSIYYFCLLQRFSFGWAEEISRLISQFVVLMRNEFDGKDQT